MSGGRIRYGYGYPLKSGDGVSNITAFFEAYVAYIERAEDDGAEVIPFVPCLFERYSTTLQPSRNASFILYDAYNVRAELDGAEPIVLSTYSCKRYQMFKLLNS
jgi:hypothetical protein